jgi:hypothetical protein
MGFESFKKQGKEIQALVHVVEARLRAEPKTSEQWAVIVQQLGEARVKAKEAMDAADRIEHAAYVEKQADSGGRAGVPRRFGSAGARKR